MKYVVSLFIEFITVVCVLVFSYTSFVPIVLHVELTDDLRNVFYTTAFIMIMVGAAVGLGSAKALLPTKYRSRKEA